MSKIRADYDNFLSEIYEYSPYFGKERREKDYATKYYLTNLPDKQNGIVLELGTCTGLLTIPMARAGYKIDSVDISSAVHKIVKSKMFNEPKDVIDNIRLKCCNVFEYQTDNRYSAIIMPDSFLLAIADQYLQDALIKKCYEILEGKGVFIADIFVPWENIIEKRELNQYTRFRTKEGELYVVYTHHLIDTEKQIHKFDFVHESYKSKKRYYHTITYRYMYLTELVDLLQNNGFEVTSINKKMNYGMNVAVVAKKK